MLVAVAGISAAVATPVVASATSAASVTREVGGAAGVEQVGSIGAPPSVEKCSAQSVDTTITFGSTNTPAEVCWTSEGGEQQVDLSKVFSLTWNTPTKWVYSGSTGQTYCKNREDTSSEEEGEAENDGSITLWKGDSSSCSGIEYLELKGSDSQTTTFLKKELQSAGSTSYNVWLCIVSNCWEGSTPFKTGQAQQVVREVGSAWKPVTFRQK